MLAPGFAAAQTPESPLLRTTTRLVQLSVTVLDKSNRPVRGLSRDEFRVVDNGIEQKIVHFSAASGDGPSETSAPSPLAISNRYTASDRPAGVTVILVDELILDAFAGVPLEIPAQIRRARLEVLKFLSTLRTREPIAIYALRRRGVVVIHDFTDDPDSLLAAAKNLGSGSNGGLASVPGLRAEVDRLREWWQGSAGIPGSHSYRTSEQASGVVLPGGFDAIVKHLQGVSGRKNLIWVSVTLPRSVSGFDLPVMLNGRDANIPVAPSLQDPTPTPKHPSQQNHYEEVRDIGRWLSNAEIALYPVNAWGLTPGGVDPAQWSAADIVASETGGRAIFDSNALDQNLQEIVDEGSTSYQIGYYPGEAAWDGKYHHVQVMLRPAHKGMVVLCRKGYYASDGPAVINSDTTLHEIATSVVEAPGIGLTLNVPSNPLSWGPQEIVLKCNGADLRFAPNGYRAKARLEIVFVQLAPDGRVVDGIKDRVEVALVPEDLAAAQTGGWFYPRNLWVNAEAEKLRVIVRDTASGVAGSVSVPIESRSKTK